MPERLIATDAATKRATRVQEHGAPELVDAVDSGAVSVSHG